MDIALATILGLVVGALLGVLGTGMVRRRQAAEFRALSSQALAASNEQFLQLALTRFGALEDATEREARARERAVETMVKPVDERLAGLQEALVQLDRRGPPRRPSCARWSASCAPPPRPSTARRRCWPPP